MTESNPTSVRPKSLRGLISLLALAVYLGAYINFSLHGQYLGNNQGGQDNRDTWAPALCAELYTSPAGRQKLRITAPGWLFLPPMLIDQWFIHRTKFVL